MKTKLIPTPNNLPDLTQARLLLAPDFQNSCWPFGTEFSLLLVGRIIERKHAKREAGKPFCETKLNKPKQI
jgi:hypothetical protein